MASTCAQWRLSSSQTTTTTSLVRYQLNAWTLRTYTFVLHPKYLRTRPNSNASGMRKHTADDGNRAGKTSDVVRWVTGKHAFEIYPIHFGGAHGAELLREFRP